MSFSHFGAFFLTSSRGFFWPLEYTRISSLLILISPQNLNHCRKKITMNLNQNVSEMCMQIRNWIITTIVSIEKKNAHLISRKLFRTSRRQWRYSYISHVSPYFYGRFMVLRFGFGFGYGF